MVVIRWTLFILFLFLLSFVMDCLGDDQMYWLWKYTFKDFP